MAACSTWGEGVLVGKACDGGGDPRSAAALSNEGVGLAGLVAIASTVSLAATNVGSAPAVELATAICACGVGGETERRGGDTGFAGGGNDVDDEAAFVVYASACHCEETQGNQEDEEVRVWPFVSAVGVRSCCTS